MIALAKALDKHPESLGKALHYYEAERRPTVEKLFKASKTSAAWYRDFANHMRLSPLDFAHSYVARSGRVDDVRLREMAPRFMALYADSRPPSPSQPMLAPSLRIQLKHPIGISVGDFFKIHCRYG